jgi:hypothetical protein
MAEIDWAGFLAQEDAEALWNGLFRLISRHPCARPLRFATDEAAVSSEFEINADLTQELFLELLQKQRFQHYADNAYTSSEIENELTRIELPNLVGARLRRRYPESFRMARRISSILKTSPNFCRVAAACPAANQAPDLLDLAGDDVDDPSSEESTSESRGTGKRQRMVNQVFALRKWGRNKAAGDPGHFAELVKSVPMRARDTRVVGRSGTSQLILSNPALEELIIEIFITIDSPADVKTVRRLALSRIPLQDYSIATLDSDSGQQYGEAPRTSAHRFATDQRLSPEAELIGEEHRKSVAGLAGDFLDRLRRAVNNNPQRFGRLIRTLWHCYYDPLEPSQIETARILGVSDSLISDNRKLIEHELKKMRLSLEDGTVFAESLRRLVVERTAPTPALH